MLKVFLVEDESVVREGLRDNIPWQQYGYEFVGESSDGEMALPMIRKLKPNVLITDIKMPFMDGLSLSRIVSQELPGIKIIIISGYDEFEYAREAIKVGVEQYLLKPITRGALQKVLLEIREKIETEQEQQNYIEKFKSEMSEYEQFTRRNFFEKVFSGQFSVQECYEEAAKLSLELGASSYNLIFVNLQEKRRDGKSDYKFSEMVLERQEELLRYFLRFSEYLVFRWNINTYAVLIKGEKDQMLDLTNRCIGNVKRICNDSDYEMDWYIAAGQPVERLSQLPELYGKVNHMFSYRFVNPSQHILIEDPEHKYSADEDGNIEKIDMAKIDPEIMKRFLAEGQIDEIRDFTSGYLTSLAEPLKSKLFRDYLMLNMRFTTIGYAESLGCSQKEFLQKLGSDVLKERSLAMEEIGSYIEALLQAVLDIRNRENENQGKTILKKALEYIDDNYAQESLSLNSASAYIGVSANYFSSIFSQEMDMTFIEYVTKKRMEAAKKLLKQSELHSGEIAAAVGYKDPHYFSFVFKKTQGCTPKEYRVSANWE